MENTNTIVSETPPSSIQKNKLPILGFALMLGGPLILLLAGGVTEFFGYIPEIAANIISWTAIILPGIGVVLSIITLFRWKKTGKLGRALALITVIMCNPVFYYTYLFLCLIASRTLAGLLWM